MQCPACQFENMDGRERCGRCGARLVWTGLADGLEGAPATRFTPPRSTKGAFGRWCERVRFRFNHASRQVVWTDKPGGPAAEPGQRRDPFEGFKTPWRTYGLFAAICSIVPGLGLFVTGRALKALGCVVGWLGLMYVLWNGWVPVYGLIFLFCAAGFHTMSALVAADIFDRKPPATRVLVSAAATIVTAYLLLYGLMAVFVTPSWWTTTQCNEPVPLLQADRGEAMFGHYRYTDWRRGDWAVFVMANCTPVPFRGGPILPIEMAATTPALVAGLPGDEVRGNKDGLWINGTPVPPEWLPEDWKNIGSSGRVNVALPPSSIDLTLADGEYFIVVQQPAVDTITSTMRLHTIGRVPGAALARATRVFWPWNRARTIPRGEWTP